MELSKVTRCILRSFFLKKIAIVFLIFATLSTIESKEILLEGKASYFISTNNRFRNIYGGTGLYRIESNIQTWKDLYVWANLGYMYAWGDTNQGSHTHLHLVPISAGVSYLFKVGCWRPYLGAGPIVAYSYIYNGSSGATRHQDGWGGGVLGKVGALAYFTDRFFIDIFADYSFIRIDYHHSNKRTIHYKGDLSGFSFGLGGGYKF